MKIKIIAAGKIKEEYFRNLLDEYSKKINKKADFEIIEVQDEKTPDNASEKEEEKIKAAEGERILSQIPEDSVLVSLDICGRKTDSKKIEEVIKMNKERNSVVFIIGGSLGLDQKVLKKSDFRISFSDMTFPHQMIRVLLSEQICNAV